MTTMTMETPASTRRLEELVDRLLSALLGGADAEADSAPCASLVRSVHRARRLRQSADLDTALATLAEVDTNNSADSELRWLYAEWLDIARRRFAGERALRYSPATGKAAVLMERDDGSLQVVSVLGMRWPVGKTVSRRSLRGLKPLAKGVARWS